MKNDIEVQIEQTEALLTSAISHRNVLFRDKKAGTAMDTVDEAITELEHEIQHHRNLIESLKRKCLP